MGIALLTNLSMTRGTRQAVIDAGAVGVIIKLADSTDTSVKQACISALRGLTSVDDNTNLVKIINSGGLEVALRLSLVNDVILQRNSAMVICNMLGHLETLNVILTSVKLRQTRDLTIECVLAVLRTFAKNDVDLMRFSIATLYNLSCMRHGDVLTHLCSGGAALSTQQMGDRRYSDYLDDPSTGPQTG